jgi:hypothetical protein
VSVCQGEEKLNKFRKVLDLISGGLFANYPNLLSMEEEIGSTPTKIAS